MPLLINVLRYLLSLSNILLNLFLIYALRQRKKLKVTSYWLIFCLSSSDVFFGISSAVNQSLWPTTKKKCWENDVCFAIDGCEFFFSNFSATFLLIIAIDRFIHMKYPLRYQSIMTKNRAILLFCFNAIFTFHIVVTIIFLPKYQRQFLLKHLRSYQIYRAVLSIVYVLIVLSVCGLYITTYSSITRRVYNVTAAPVMVMKEVAPSRDNDCNALQSSLYRRRRRPNQDFKVCIVLIIILVLLLEVPNLFISVYIRIAMLFNSRFTYSDEIILAAQWTYLLVQLNSTLNAAVLLVFSRELRQYTRRLFKCSKPPA